MWWKGITTTPNRRDAHLPGKTMDVSSWTLHRCVCVCVFVWMIESDEGWTGRGCRGWWPGPPLAIGWDNTVRHVTVNKAIDPTMWTVITLAATLAALVRGDAGTTRTLTIAFVPQPITGIRLGLAIPAQHLFTVGRLVSGPPFVHGYDAVAAWLDVFAASWHVTSTGVWAVRQRRMRGDDVIP